jgi:hypothetical protein
MTDQEKIVAFEKKIAFYEENGPAKLYYSLNRKAWEMADMLNSINLKNLQLDDPKDKTFERMRFIINDSAGIAAAVKTLGDAAGVTGNEGDDIRNTRRITTPESIANVLGNTAGQQD